MGVMALTMDLLVTVSPVILIVPVNQSQKQLRQIRGAVVWPFESLLSIKVRSSVTRNQKSKT